METNEVAGCDCESAPSEEIPYVDALLLELRDEIEAGAIENPAAKAMVEALFLLALEERGELEPE